MLLHPRVARLKFEALIAHIEEASNAGGHSWRLIHAAFPDIRVHVLAPDGVPVLQLQVGAANYPHHALSVSALNLQGGPILSTAIPGRPDEQGNTHIYPLADGRAWFCTEGTDEFHSTYPSALPWERTRQYASGDSVNMLDAVVRLIDIERLAAARQGAQS